MGEAAKRKAREVAWLESLDTDERILVDVARRLSAILPPYGACYQASLFLRYHLEKAHGLVGKAVIGFVNDGTDDLYCSHAWFTYKDAMTDLAISRPLRPDLQRPGPLVIHNYEFKPGWRWTYHLSEPPESRAVLQELRDHPDFGSQIREEENIRARMLMIANDTDAIRAYLDGADNGLTYEVLASVRDDRSLLSGN